jgi:lipopolysaccharide/colanic/teichoic acid biosynthesis glycosyltransferase
MKCFFDFILSGLLLALFSPVLVLVSFLIKLSMPGPVFFAQFRVGKDGRLFKLIKFRTMETMKIAESYGFNAGDTSRITPLGRFLRKTKLDELPEFINVLRGEMSIVGPRPEVKRWTEVYPEKWSIIHSIKPGITDNASIEFRNEEEILSRSQNPEETYYNLILPRKLDLYIDYVNNQTLWGDVMIILRTINVVLFR